MRRLLPRGLSLALGLLPLWGLAEAPEPCLQGGKEGLSVNASPRCIEAFREQGMADRFKAAVERSVAQRQRASRESKGEESRSNLKQLMQKSAAEHPTKPGYYGQQ
jgi:hypothetical protein